METKTRLLPYSYPSLTETYTEMRDLIEGSFVKGEGRTDGKPVLDYFLTGAQSTESESHPQWRTRKMGIFKGDIGGPFRSINRRFYVDGNPVATIQNSWGENPTPQFPAGSIQRLYRYHGPYLPIAPDAMRWPAVSPSEISHLYTLGTQAIARCSPSNPAASLSETVGEIIREGIPKLIGSTIGSLRGKSPRERRKALAGEYLNYEFGWKPLVNSILEFSQAIVNADEIIRSYERDSGRMVRRAYDFPMQETVEVTDVAKNVSPWVHASSSAIIDWSTVNQGKVILETKTRTRRWFRGAFSYYVPPPDGVRNSIARDVIFARKALGLSLSPDVVWNLSPWSWMFDWFFNAGDVISNWADWAIDNQVLMYGYIMEHKVQMNTYTFSGPHGYTGSGLPPSCSLVTESKIRERATPYGFGLHWDGFSPRQWAILTALGLTRGK